jgi:CubicO group peptidase (beta-lactamase class C family)
MRSVILEPDAAGTFVGSTYMYATARDWARFGLLYLQDGIWEGERILPEGWVAYSTTPTPTDPRGEYGAHFWTNSSRDRNGKQGQWPNLPSDAFFALGHDGQSLTIIPSRRLVVVRLGLTKDPKTWSLDSFIADVLKAVSDEGE